MLENLDKIMHLLLNFDAFPMHSLFRFVHLTHQNLSARALFCLNSLARVNTQLLIYNYEIIKIVMLTLRYYFIRLYGYNIYIQYLVANLKRGLQQAIYTSKFLRPAIQVSYYAVLLWLLQVGGYYEGTLMLL